MPCCILAAMLFGWLALSAHRVGSCWRALRGDPESTSTFAPPARVTVGASRVGVN